MAEEDDERNDRGGGWWPDGERGGGRRPSGRTPRRPSGRDERQGHTPPRGLASPDAPKRASRYSMFVGLAFTAIIVIALLNLVGNDDAGIAGVSGEEEGQPLAEFALPSLRGRSDADANVFQDDCESSRNPCPAEQQRTPACEIDPSEAIRVCDLFDKPLAVSFWFTRGGDCNPPQDAFDRVARRYEGRVNFLSVNIRDDRSTVAEVVRERGWRVPVGLDPDGAVSNLYRVGLCPTIELAYPGGILYRARTAYAPDEVRGFVEDLLRASKLRAATSR